jgi:hypothetical protein
MTNDRFTSIVPVLRLRPSRPSKIRCGNGMVEGRTTSAEVTPPQLVAATHPLPSHLSHRARNGLTYAAAA